MPPAAGWSAARTRAAGLDLFHLKGRGPTIDLHADLTYEPLRSLHVHPHCDGMPFEVQTTYVRGVPALVPKLAIVSALPMRASNSNTTKYTTVLTNRANRISVMNAICAANARK